MRKYYQWLFVLFYFIGFETASGQILWKVGSYTAGLGTVAGFPNHIPIASFQMGAEASLSFTQGNPPSPGPAQLSPIEITKAIDVLSNYLALHLGNSTSVSEIEIVWVSSSNLSGKVEVVHKVELTGVKVSSLTAASNEGCIGCGSEACSLVFDRLKRSTYTRDASGRVMLANTLTWDVVTNKVSVSRP